MSKTFLDGWLSQHAKTVEKLEADKAMASKKDEHPVNAHKDTLSPPASLATRKRQRRTLLLDPSDDSSRNVIPKKENRSDDNPRNEIPNKENPSDDNPRNEIPNKADPSDDDPRNETPNQEDPSDDNPRNETPNQEDPAGITVAHPSVTNNSDAREAYLEIEASCDQHVQGKDQDRSVSTSKFTKKTSEPSDSLYSSTQNKRDEVVDEHLLEPNALNTPPQEKRLKRDILTQKAPKKQVISTTNDSNEDVLDHELVQDEAIEKTKIKNVEKTALKKQESHGKDAAVQPPVACTHDDTLPLHERKCVLTGIFSTCSREKMEHHIKRLGGQVMSAVSGRTHFLITGYILENNKPVHMGSKYKRAMQLQSENKGCLLQVLSENEFLKEYPMTDDTSSMAFLPTPVLSSATINDSHAIHQNAANVDRTTPSTPAPPQQRRLNTQTESNQTLWCEKYRPKTSREIIGNGETLRKLHAWLTHWYSVCILHMDHLIVKSRSTSRFVDAERPSARACMLSGLPGVGKTTAARVVALECGYRILEFNSSDDRGKHIIEVIQDMTSGGQTLDSFLHNKRASLDASKSVLIMDEMDGLSSGDRGGAQALMKLIETTRCPVICICNDRSSTKVRSLASKCYDLRFQRPPKNLVAKRVCEIAQLEGFSMDYNAAELLCERVGNDIRQILNSLQIICGNSCLQRKISFDVMRHHIGFGIKDDQVMTNIFDMTRKLLSRHDACSLSFNERLDGFFVDYDLMPLQMQENYVQAFLPFAQRTGSVEDCCGVVASAADSFTFADVINKKVRKDGYWTLLGDVGFLSTVLPSYTVSGFVTRTEFPQWLGKNSTTLRNRRLLSELSLYLGLVTFTTLVEMRTSGYLDVLYEKIFEPFLYGEFNDRKEAAELSVKLMNTYGITKQQVFENLGYLRLKIQKQLPDALDASTKRTLTTVYKNHSAPLRVDPHLAKTQKKARAALTQFNEPSEEADVEGTAPLKESMEEKKDTIISAGHGEDDSESDSGAGVLVSKPLKKTTPRSKGKAISASSQAHRSKTVHTSQPKGRKRDKAIT